MTARQARAAKRRKARVYVAVFDRTATLMAEWTITRVIPGPNGPLMWAEQQDPLDWSTIRVVQP